MKTLPFLVFEVASGGEVKQSVQSVALNVEGCHASRSCYSYLVSQQQSQAVDEVRLASSSST